MYGLRWRSHFILLHVDIQFSQHHWLKRVFLPPLNFLGTFVENQLTVNQGLHMTQANPITVVSLGWGRWHMWQTCDWWGRPEGLKRAGRLRRPWQTSPRVTLRTIPWGFPPAEEDTEAQGHSHSTGKRPSQEPKQGSWLPNLNPITLHCRVSSCQKSSYCCKRVSDLRWFMYTCCFINSTGPFHHISRSPQCVGLGAPAITVTRSRTSVVGGLCSQRSLSWTGRFLGQS